MTVPKKHHYVPKMLLRRFVDQGGKLWHYNKKIPAAGVLHDWPSDIFFKKHFYSTIDQTGHKNVALEIALSKLETRVSPIIGKICDAGMLGELPNLMTQERCVLDEYIYFQWKRTPDALTASLTEAQFRNSVIESIEKFEQTERPITEQEREEMLQGKAFQRLFRNVRIQVVAQKGEEVLAAMRQCGLAIGRIVSENKSLVIGSNPIIKFTGKTETRIGRGAVELWFPMSSKIAVCAISGPAREVMALLSTQQIRALNLSMYNQSTGIAGRSEKQIISLVSNR